MRVAYLVIVALHAMIHVLGFVKGFEIREIKELSIPVSRPMGILWLSAAILLLLYGVMYFSNNRYSWVIGVMAVILSQFLVLYFWSDAKFGTIPNIIILIIAVMDFGSFRFNNMVEREKALLLSENITSDGGTVSETDIRALPVPVQKWLQHSGVVGKPYISMGRVEQKAKMKLKKEDDKWMDATAVQYTTIDEPAFIWTTEVRINRLLYFLGRDKFKDGRGEMLIKLNSVLNVVNEEGRKLDEGSLQRYLGEMVWFPSLAMSPYISWEAIDSTSARATLDYKGTSGSGTFYFDENGDFIRFSAQRFMGNEVGAERHEWVMLVEAYREFEGIRVPSQMSATWKLEDGDWTWLKLEVTDLRYNFRK